MSTNSTQDQERAALIRQVARALRRTTKTGLWGNPEATTQGVPVAYNGDEPAAFITPEEVERRIAAVSHAGHRQRMQVRLGLGDYRAWASSDRQAKLNELYDRRPADQRRSRSPMPSRTITDRLSEDIAVALLAGSPSGPRPRYDSTRLLYSRSIVLPPNNVGEVEEVHRRVIRAEVNGLNRIVIHQTEHWNSSVTATAKGMGGVTIRPLRVREDEHNGIAGERLDVEVRFPTMKAGEIRELQWTRRRQLEPGWLSDSRSMVFASAPDHPTELMVIEVQFGEAALPTTVMRFDDVYQGDRLDPDLDMTVVHPHGGAVRCEWQHPRIGLASGIRVWW